MVQCRSGNWLSSVSELGLCCGCQPLPNTVTASGPCIFLNFYLIAGVCSGFILNLVTFSAHFSLQYLYKFPCNLISNFKAICHFWAVYIFQLWKVLLKENLNSWPTENAFFSKLFIGKMSLNLCLCSWWVGGRCRNSRRVLALMLYPVHCSPHGSSGTCIGTSPGDQASERCPLSVTRHPVH